jgi:hypothetical protein
MTLKRFLTKLAILSAALGVATGVQSATFGAASTYTGMVWVVSTNVAGISSCNRLILDATADFSHGTGLNMNGALNCQTGAYGAFGSAFLTTDNTLFMTLNVGVNRVAVCQFTPTLSSTCGIYSADATYLGPATIALL